MEEFFEFDNLYYSWNYNYYNMNYYYYNYLYSDCYYYRNLLRYHQVKKLHL